MTNQKNKLLLCILDGWGVIRGHEHDAIYNADTPNFDRFLKDYPNSELKTSGLDVGLPDGQMGNSEVGHMTIGSGRIIFQNLPKINKSIENGEFEKLEQIKKLKNASGAIHIIGLCSDGGVHAHIDHIKELSKILGDKKYYIHAITDGRDVAQKSALEYVDGLENIATIGGRYYTMDRDNKWERTQLGYDAMVNGVGRKAESAEDAINNSYAEDINDEFILPCVIGDYDGIKDGDSVIIVNFRADRVRQLTEALFKPEFNGFESPKLHLENKITFVEYAEFLSPYHEILFPSEEIKNTLGEVVSNEGLRQFRTSETEKYAHVTFFFNGGKEEVYKNEVRELVKSPDVATYDLKPEMSSGEVTEALLRAINSEDYELIVVNFANTDMVGHTGIQSAAVKAVKAVDKCLGKLESACIEHGYSMLVSADHGNAEQMIDENGKPHTQHTTGPVPFIVIDNNVTEVSDGILSDIAPTALRLLNVDIPDEMTGKVLTT